MMIPYNQKTHPNPTRSSRDTEVSRPFPFFSFRASNSDSNFGFGIFEERKDEGGQRGFFLPWEEVEEIK